MRFVDTNVLLRYLTRDDEAKAAACFSLFQRVKNADEEVTLSEVIIHEALYVLCSRAHYGLTHEEAVARLRPILALRGLRLPKKRVYLRALDIYSADAALDPGDALAIAHMEDQGLTEILSYDTDFDAHPEITRVEP